MQQRRENLLLRSIETLVLAGIMSAGGLGVSVLREICHELAEIKTNLAGEMTQSASDRKRIDRVEAVVFHH